MSKCKDCRYGFYSGIDGIIGCEYLLVRHEPRGCPVNECDKFESAAGAPKKSRKDIRIGRKNSMAKLTEENKRSIITANSAGATVTSLAEKYNVSKSAIYNVIKDFNNRGETALSGETEVDTEKEPATAATETDSEQEICNDIPADIIPEKSEDVKPESENAEPLIPQAVIEACWGRMDELRNQIAQEQAVIDDWKRQIAEIKEFLELARIANPAGGAA